LIEERNKHRKVLVMPMLQCDPAIMFNSAPSPGNRGHHHHPHHQASLFPGYGYHYTAQPPPQTGHHTMTPNQFGSDYNQVSKSISTSPAIIPEF
jgi:hypothetical protein